MKDEMMKLKTNKMKMKTQFKLNKCKIKMMNKFKTKFKNKKKNLSAMMTVEMMKSKKIPNKIIIRMKSIHNLITKI